MDNNYQGEERGDRKKANFILSKTQLGNCPPFFLSSVIIYLSCFCI